MISLHDWIFSVYPPNSGINGTWGILHIITLIAVVAIIVAMPFLFRAKSEKTRRIVIFTIAALIFIFELSRRIINFSRGEQMDFTAVMRTFLPRPWCAISCWCFMASVIVNKKFFYNFTAATSFLCTLIFFAYPTVGFNNKYILFENLYSICTHALLMIGAITLITLKFTDFDYKKDVWKELICLAVTFVYAFIEIFLLKIEADPLYFMPGNEAQGVLGLEYPVYLVVYILFLIVYFCAFYAVQHFVMKKKSEAQTIK